MHMKLLTIMLLQLVTMFQPKPIADLGCGEVVAVEIGQNATHVRLRNVASVAGQTSVPATAYLSDESDRHHALIKWVREGQDLLLDFEPLPPTTRVFDLVLDHRRRWLGVHSSVRLMSFPDVRPKYDEEAKIADSIDSLLSDFSFSELSKSDTIVAQLRTRLPLLRNYVAWKWKLSPHEVFVLARYHQKLETAATDDMVSTPVLNASATKEAGRSFTSMPSPPKVRRGLLSRMLGKPKRDDLPPSAAVKPRKIKPLSRFEQKMLQEERVRGR